MDTETSKFLTQLQIRRFVDHHAAFCEISMVYVKIDFNRFAFFNVVMCPKCREINMIIIKIEEF